MAQWTRRQLIGTTAGVAVASLAAYVWNLHQHLPARDPDAEERFLRAQALLLAANGDRVHSRFVQIADPGLRVQVLDGGQGDPVLLLHGGDGVARKRKPDWWDVSGKALVLATQTAVFVTALIGLASQPVGSDGGRLPT